MKLKTFSIYASIILSLLVVSCIVCCFIIIPTPFNFTEKPTSITVYNYAISSKGETTNSNNMKEKYNELSDAFINCTNFSVFERIVSGANIFDKPGLDESQKRPTWATAKSNKATIELEFETTQYIYAYVNGNSRRIDFVALAMVVSKDSTVHEVAIYYKSPRDQNYNTIQIIMQVKTNRLYEIISTIIE